jgi:hypothetical protein
MYQAKSKNRFTHVSLILVAFIFGMLSGKYWHMISNRTPMLISAPELARTSSQEDNHVTSPRTEIAFLNSDGSNLKNSHTVDTRVFPREQIKVNREPTIFGLDILNTSVSNQLATIEAMLMNHNAGDEKKLNREFQKLITSVGIDPGVRKIVLERFLDAAGTEMGVMLGSVLSSTKDTEVESAVLHLAQDGSSPEQRLAALEFLNQSQTQQQSTRSALLDVLKNQSEVDNRAVSATMSALTNRRPVSLSEQDGVINAIKPYIESASPSLRKSGINSLAEWAPQDHVVLQTVTAGTQDPDLSVRISAVQSLGQNGFRFEDVRDTIITKLQDQQENFQVRVAAWRALDNYPLDDQTYSTYAEFKRNYPSQTIDPN